MVRPSAGWGRLLFWVREGVSVKGCFRWLLLLFIRRVLAGLSEQVGGVEQVGFDSKQHQSGRVTGTGFLIGIAPENLTHIFERFYQGSTNGRSADGPNSQAYGGTGIGLALVHELVRVLGGHVRVTSAIGQGTAFTITLPLMRVDKPGLPQPTVTKSSPLMLQDAMVLASSSPVIPPPGG